MRAGRLRRESELRRSAADDDPRRRGRGDRVAELVERLERSGVDQVIFALQTGHTKHEHICDSLELFAERVLPRFAERADQVDAERRERLAAACARAVARRAPPRKAPRYVISPQSEPTPAYEMRGAEPSAASGDGASLDDGASLGRRLNTL